MKNKKATSGSNRFQRDKKTPPQGWSPVLRSLNEPAKQEEGKKGAEEERRQPGWYSRDVMYSWKQSQTNSVLLYRKTARP